MKLCYRGTQYDSVPSTLEIPESSVTGYYRGHTFDLKYPRHIPVPQVGLNLNYRGTAYRVSATGGLETIAALTSTVPVKPLTTTRLSAQQGNLAEVHRENICRSLQHRLHVARTAGNYSLIQQLEQEMHQVV